MAQTYDTTNKTSLYQALSGLNLTDKKIYQKLHALSATVSSTYMPSANFLEYKTIEGSSKLLIKEDNLPAALKGDFSTVNANINTITGNLKTVSGDLDALQLVAVTGVQDSNTLDFTKDGNTISANLKTHTSGVLTSDANGLYIQHDGSLKIASNKLGVVVDDNTIKTTSAGALSANIDGITILSGTNGLKTGISLSSITQGETSEYASEYALVDNNGIQIGTTTIQIKKDQFLKSATVVTSTSSKTYVSGDPSGTKYLELIFIVADATNGTKQEKVYVNLTQMINDYSSGTTSIEVSTDNKISLVLASSNSGLDQTSGLMVVPNTSGAVKVDANGIGVKVDTTKAVKIDDTNGIQVLATSGLAIDSTNGLYVNAVSGLEIDSTTKKLVAKVDTASGIKISTNGIAINPGFGLTSGDNKLKIDYDTNSLTSDTNKLKVNIQANKGLAVTSAGIKVDAGHGLDTSSASGLFIKLNTSANDGKYLTLGASGIGLSGIDTAIDTAKSSIINDLYAGTGQTKGTTAAPADGTILSAIYGKIDYVSGQVSSNDTDISNLSSNKANKVSLATEGNVVLFGTSGDIKDDGFSIISGLAEYSSASDKKLPSEKAIRTAINKVLYGGDGKTVPTSGVLETTSPGTGLVNRVNLVQSNYSNLITMIETLNSNVTGFSAIS